MATEATDETGGRVTIAPRDDVAGLRRRHARAFVAWARPAVVGVMGLVALVTALFDRSLLQPIDFYALGSAVAVALVGLALSRRIDTLYIANASIVADTLILGVWIAGSPHQSETATMLLWPIIALAYFASPRWSLFVATCSAIAVTIASKSLANWDDDQVVPIAASTLLCSGVFIAFVTQQARRIEAVLVAGRVRDVRVLAMSRRMHLAEDPAAAIQQLAREVGVGLDVDAAAVATVARDGSGAITMVATWQRAQGLLEITPDAYYAAVHDALHPRHAAVLDARGPRLITLDPGRIEPAGVTAPRSAVTGVGSSFATVGELFAGGGCLLVPLTLRDEVIAAVIVAGPLTLDWERDILPVLQPLAPQLAAGLAQVMLVRDQQRALAQLEQVARMRDRLIANVSHELRTPLTSTLGFIDTILREDVEFDEATRTLLMQHARSGGLRLLALVEDLLALGSIRPESLVLESDLVPVDELFVAACSGLELPEGRNLNAVVIPNDAPELRVDRYRMLQVLGNILVNAIQHGAGDIDLTCDVADGCAIIDLLDDGDGIDPMHLSELFLPFARFSTRTDSTGLGLAICRTIIEAHGGTIDYGRTYSGRTRFRITLPLAPAAA